MKVLIADKTGAVCENILINASHTVDVITGLPPDELKKIIPEYHGIIIRSATKLTADIIDSAKNLKVIGRAGTGIDNVDVDAATKRNIVVMNTPGGNSNAVAELVFAQMINLSRDLYHAVSTLKSSQWEKKKFTGYEITGKTLGLLGYGSISRLVGEKAIAFGLNVLCYDPKINKNISDDRGIKLVNSLDMLLSTADLISIHLSKRDDTTNFIDAKQFAKMKPGVFFINYARGGLVNEQALLNALNQEIVAGAAIDVYETEPPTDFNLVNHPKVICTPHIGAASFESQERVARMIAEQFVDMFAGKPIRNSVNL